MYGQRRTLRSGFAAFLSPGDAGVAGDTVPLLGVEVRSPAEEQLHERERAAVGLVSERQQQQRRIEDIKDDGTKRA